MPKRERYEVKIRCPKCGHEGIALWEENENPIYAGGRLDEELIKVSDGFEKVNKNKIKCTKCNLIISESNDLSYF